MSGKLLMDPLNVFRKLLNGTSIGTHRNEGMSTLKLLGQIVKLFMNVQALITNQQSRVLSKRVINQHYDFGNDFYENILGSTMAYTCGYWKNATNLDEAQIHKFDLVRRKLQLTAGMNVVEIGMGWGFAANFIQLRDNVNVTGITLSLEQLNFAKGRHPERPGLRYLLMDYRDFCENPKELGTYDGLYSIGFLEHVGPHNYQSFFKCVRDILKPNGIAVIQTIGELNFNLHMDPFLDKYIFPGAVIPSLAWLTQSFEDLLILEDYHNFGYDYSKTLQAWSQRADVYFETYPRKHPQEFQRMWEYYLKMSQVLFELRINQLWQLVLTPRHTTRFGVVRQL